MNAGKNTPGPWTASGTQVCTWTKENYATNVPFTYDPPLPPGSRQWTEKLIDEAKANARLIAAAPDMLEALDVVRGCLASIDIECLSRSDRREIEKAEAYIEDALAKAKGEV